MQLYRVILYSFKLSEVMKNIQVFFRFKHMFMLSLTIVTAISCSSNQQEHQTDPTWSIPENETYLYQDSNGFNQLYAERYMERPFQEYEKWINRTSYNIGLMNYIGYESEEDLKQYLRLFEKKIRSAYKQGYTGDNRFGPYHMQAITILFTADAQGQVKRINIATHESLGITEEELRNFKDKVLAGTQGLLKLKVLDTAWYLKGREERRPPLPLPDSLIEQASSLRTLFCLGVPALVEWLDQKETKLSAITWRPHDGALNLCSTNPWINTPVNPWLKSSKGFNRKSKKRQKDTYIYKQTPSYESLYSEIILLQSVREEYISWIRDNYFGVTSYIGFEDEQLLKVYLRTFEKQIRAAYKKGIEYSGGVAYRRSAIEIQFISDRDMRLKSVSITVSSCLNISETELRHFAADLVEGSKGEIRLKLIENPTEGWGIGNERNRPIPRIPDELIQKATLFETYFSLNLKALVEWFDGEKMKLFHWR